MKNKILLVLLLIVTLTGCSTQEVKPIQNQETNVEQVILSPTKYVKTDSTFINFNGFSNKESEGWTISFSSGGSGAVNEYYIVNEGTRIDYNGKKIKIIKMEPAKNELTIEIEK